MYVKFKEYNSKILEKIEEEEALNKNITINNEELIFKNSLKELNPEKLKYGFNILSV